jgi:hypothetical protein
MMNPLGLVHTVDGFCHGIVIAVATAADLGSDPRLGQPLGVPKAHVLRPTI